MTWTAKLSKWVVPIMVFCYYQLQMWCLWCWCCWCWWRQWWQSALSNMLWGSNQQTCSLISKVCLGSSGKQNREDCENWWSCCQTSRCYKDGTRVDAKVGTRRFIALAPTGNMIVNEDNVENELGNHVWVIFFNVFFGTILCTKLTQQNHFLVVFMKCVITFWQGWEEPNFWRT